jgi:phosphoribosylanthranilate isomerase
MINGIRLKICGLTTLVDAESADKCGADYLGFNLYPKSPRHITLTQYTSMAPRLPDRRKVAVAVEPTLAELTAMKTAGFDYFQIHFRHDISLTTVASWSEAVGAACLWLAPKLPPNVDVPPAWLNLVDYCLLDTFTDDKFGGSGKTSDWEKFARHRATYPRKHWILAGGLSPDNVAAAIKKTGARFVDVNSGVETSPGVKNRDMLERFVARLSGSRAG